VAITPPINQLDEISSIGEESRDYFSHTLFIKKPNEIVTKNFSSRQQNSSNNFERNFVSQNSFIRPKQDVYYLGPTCKKPFITRIFFFETLFSVHVSLNRSSSLTL